MPSILRRRKHNDIVVKDDDTSPSTEDTADNKERHEHSSGDDDDVVIDEDGEDQDEAESSSLDDGELPRLAVRSSSMSSAGGPQSGRLVNGQRTTTRPLSPPSQAGLIGAAAPMAKAKNSGKRGVEKEGTNENDNMPDDEYVSRTVRRRFMENKEKQDDETTYVTGDSDARHNLIDDGLCGSALSAIHNMCGTTEDSTFSPSKSVSNKPRMSLGDPEEEEPVHNRSRLKVPKATDIPFGAEEQTAIEVEYVDPNFIPGAEPPIVAPSGFTPQRKNAYLAAMAQKAKQNFNNSSTAKKPKKHPLAPGYSAAMTPSLASSSILSNDDDDHSAQENLYSTFSAAEKRKFLKLINNGVSPSESTQQVLTEREEQQEAAALIKANMRPESPLPQQQEQEQRAALSPISPKTPIKEPAKRGKKKNGETFASSGINYYDAVRKERGDAMTDGEAQGGSQEKTKKPSLRGIFSRAKGKNKKKAFAPLSEEKVAEVEYDDIDDDDDSLLDTDTDGEGPPVDPPRSMLASPNEEDEKDEEASVEPYLSPRESQHQQQEQSDVAPSVISPLTPGSPAIFGIQQSHSAPADMNRDLHLPELQTQSSGPTLRSQFSIEEEEDIIVAPSAPREVSESRSGTMLRDDAEEKEEERIPQDATPSASASRNMHVQFDQDSISPEKSSAALRSAEEFLARVAGEQTATVSSVQKTPTNGMNNGKSVEVKNDMTLDLDTYMDSTDMFSEYGGTVKTGDQSSVISYRTAGTSLTTNTVSTRVRRPGAAKSRIAKVAPVAKQEQQQQQSRVAPKRSGWHESMMAAAANANRRWDPQVGWVDYTDVADSIEDSDQVTVSKEKLRVHLDLKSQRNRDKESDANSDDKSEPVPVPFPISWKRERDDMITPVPQESPVVRSLEVKPSTSHPIELSQIEEEDSEFTPSFPEEEEEAPVVEAAQEQAPRRVKSHPKRLVPQRRALEAGERSPSKNRGWVESMKAATASLSKDGKKWHPELGWIGGEEDGASEWQDVTEEPHESQQARESEADQPNQMIDEKEETARAVPSIQTNSSPSETDVQMFDIPVDPAVALTSIPVPVTPSPTHESRDQVSNKKLSSQLTGHSHKSAESGGSSNHHNDGAARYFQIGDSGSVKSHYHVQGNDVTSVIKEKKEAAVERANALNRQNNIVRMEQLDENSEQTSVLVDVVKEKVDENEADLFSGSQGQSSKIPKTNSNDGSADDSFDNGTDFSWDNDSFLTGKVDTAMLKETPARTQKPIQSEGISRRPRSSGKLKMSVKESPSSSVPNAYSFDSVSTSSKSIPLLRGPKRDTSPIRKKRSAPQIPPVSQPPRNSTPVERMREVIPVVSPDSGSLQQAPEDDAHTQHTASTVHSTASVVKLRAQQWELRATNSKDEAEKLEPEIAEIAGTAEWKSFLVKKVRAETALAAQQGVGNHERLDANKLRTLNSSGQGDRPRARRDTEKDSIFNFSAVNVQKPLNRNPPDVRDTARDESFEAISDISPIKVREDYETVVSESSTGQPDQSSSFLKRLQACAAPMMPRNMTAGDGACNPVPLSHLAFLRTNPTASSGGKPRGHDIVPDGLCGRPDVIFEEDEETDNGDATVDDTVDTRQTREYLPEGKQRSSSRSKLRSISPRKSSDIGSVISDEMGGKTAYLERIAMKAAVSGSGPKKTRRRPTPSEVSGSTISSQHSEKWQKFLEKKNTNKAPGSSRSSTQDVSKAAEKYTSEKVDQMMARMRSKSNPRTRPEDATGAFPTVGAEDDLRPSKSDFGEAASGRPKISESARAAEDLAAARFEAMMHALSSTNLDGQAEI